MAKKMKILWKNRQIIKFTNNKFNRVNSRGEVIPADECFPEVRDLNCQNPRLGRINGRETAFQDCTVNTVKFIKNNSILCIISFKTKLESKNNRNRFELEFEI